MGETKKPALGEIRTESVSGSLHCEILTNTASQNLELKGVVWSSDGAIGRYNFIISKQGLSGSSNVAQSGLFDVAPNERKIVGTVMVNASAGDRYSARLSVQSGGSETVCDTILD